MTSRVAAQRFVPKHVPASPRRVPSLVALAVVVAGLCLASSAIADTSTIKRPGAHPRYSLEAEPHLLLGVGNPPGPVQGNGYGPGGRFTFELVDNGFVSSINNTVGIGFGADLLFYGSADAVICTGPVGNQTCVRESRDYRELVLPLVMQWNFWVSRDWSVFGEPGIAYRFRRNDKDRLDPFVFYAGGRYHFADNLSLTLRLGYPSVSVGVSFLL